MKVLVAQSCPTLCHPMDCSLPGFSVHGILQARILEWRPCPPPGDLPDSRPLPLAGGFFTTSTTWEARISDIEGMIAILKCCEFKLGSRGPFLCPEKTPASSSHVRAMTSPNHSLAFCASHISPERLRCQGFKERPAGKEPREDRRP